MRSNFVMQAPALSALAAALVVLAGCGGGGGGASPAPQASISPSGPKAASASLYFTDDFSAAYDAVWIGVSKVAADGREALALSARPAYRALGRKTLTPWTRSRA